MTYACPTFGHAADAHLLQLLRLQNRDLCATENLDNYTPVCVLHVNFKISYVYDYINKLFRIQAEAILNHVNPNVRGTVEGEAKHRKYKRHGLGGGQVSERSAD
jgi:hypothetical protein